MWVKTTCCNRLYLLLIRNFFLHFFVLVQSYTSTQASTCKRLQPSLILQLLLEGSYNTLALVLADMFTSTQVSAYRRLQPSLFFQGPRFINFQTGSMNNINQTSSIFVSPNLLCTKQTESNSHFSECCTQKVVTVTRHQF